MIAIRPEAQDDFATLRELQRTAFAPSELEAEIADALRAAGDHVPELCLVATDEGTIVGHVMLSTAHVAPPDAWMALALPAHEPRIRGRFRYAEAFG